MTPIVAFLERSDTKRTEEVPCLQILMIEHGTVREWVVPIGMHQNRFFGEDDTVAMRRSRNDYRLLTTQRVCTAFLQVTIQYRAMHFCDKTNHPQPNPGPETQYPEETALSGISPFVAGGRTSGQTEYSR